MKLLNRYGPSALFFLCSFLAARAASLAPDHHILRGWFLVMSIFTGGVASVSLILPLPD
jgi:zinc transporter ZupT